MHILLYNPDNGTLNVIPSWGLVSPVYFLGLCHNTYHMALQR